MKLRFPVRIIRTKNLTALREGAERAAGLAGAAGLAAELESAENTIEEYKADARKMAGAVQQLSTDNRELRTEMAVTAQENSELGQLVQLLLGACEYLNTAAHGPVSVLLRDGRVHSVHRDQQAAMDEVPLGPGESWVQARPDDLANGWRVRTERLQELPLPPKAAEIEVLLERLERPAVEKLRNAQEVAT